MAKELIIEKSVFNKLIKGKSLTKSQDDFNQFIEDTITQTLKNPNFSDLRVFALGSLGQRRLCPYSDVDILVVGEMAKVKILAAELSKTIKHLKVRQTVDEFNKAGLLWKKSFNVFDHYSLSFGRPFLPRDQEYFEELKIKQQAFLNKHKAKARQQVLDEKEKRSSRYSDVAGLLQPNFKFGKGSLRDITQALGWLNWFAADFDPALVKKMLVHLKTYYDQISQLRFAVQLLHENDYVSADMWEALGEKVGQHLLVLDLQKNIHKIFNEVKIISDVVFQEAETISNVKKTVFLELEDKDIATVCHKIENTNFTPEEVLSLRWSFQAQSLSQATKKQIFKSVNQRFLSPMDESFCAQLFDAYIIPSVIPHWENIEGRPQSGHYHKYTVDHHLLKTLESVCMIQNKAVDLFRLGHFVLEMTEEDFRLLKWGSIFHDLAKGLPGDHSEVGAEVLENEIHFLDWDEKFKNFLVELTRHHLLLSKAAFRYDHNDVENLQSIHEALKSFKFFKVLTLFTAADIMASNPEAWNEWKSEQFFHLSESFQAYINNGQVNSLLDIKGFQILVALANRLGEDNLIEDIESLAEKDFDFKVFEFNHNFWIRMYDKDSGPGVLVKMLSLFFQAGLSIEQAFICGSDKHKVAYNWFRLSLKTSKTKNEITKTLNTLIKYPADPVKTMAKLRVRLNSIRLLSAIENKWVFLFKGLDQKGLLLRITQVFSDLQLNILKAQVNTWGESVEDVFVIERRPDLSLETVQETLRKELVDNFWQWQ